MVVATNSQDNRATLQVPGSTISGPGFDRKSFRSTGLWRLNRRHGLSQVNRKFIGIGDTTIVT